MADTITVLDGIQFAKPDTADVYTLDSPTQEAVMTYPVSLPPDISAARVIFNAGIATANTKCHCRVRCTKLTAIGTLAKTQNTQGLEWTTVTAPAILESGEINVSDAYEATLHIDVALSSTTAVTVGIEIIIQVRKEATVDEWTTLVRFGGPIGTGMKSDFVGTNNQNATTLGVTNPTTGKLNNIGKHIFFEDTATIAQCEIAFLVSQSGD